MCGALLLFGYAKVTEHETILGGKLVGKSQRDLFLTRGKSKGYLEHYRVIG